MNEKKVNEIRLRYKKEYGTFLSSYVFKYLDNQPHFKLFSGLNSFKTKHIYHQPI